MSWLDGVRHRVRTLLDPAGFARDIDAEAAFHLDLDAMHAGDRDRARRRFGNRTYYTEERRRMTWLAAFDGFRQDVFYAWRSIRRTPGFAIAVIVTLALGIGVNAATFSTLDRLYLRTPGGVVDPASLRRVWLEYIMSDDVVSSRDDRTFLSPATSYPLYRAIADASGDSGSVALYAVSSEGRGDRSANTVYATANYFRVLGVRAALGRVYGPEEDRFESGGARVAVVSDRFWRTRLGADSGAVGRPLKVGSRMYTVIGVMPPAFSGLDLQAADVWIPFAAQPVPPWINTPRWWEGEWNYSYMTVMRIPRAFSDAAFHQRATDAVRRRNRVKSHPGRDTLMQVFTGSIILARGPGKPRQEQIISTRLGGVAVLVLLIACANVLNLVLARAVRRRREIAVRLALGISRARLVRLLTAETMLLALFATAVALLVGWWTGTLLRALLFPEVTWPQSVFDWRLVRFGLAVGVACVLIAGLFPALQSSKPQLVSGLKDGAREPGSARRRVRLRVSLVVAQAALSIVLLAGAALFVRSLRNVTALDIGYDRDRLVIGWVSFEDDQRVPEAVESAAIDRVEQEMAARPEAESVSRAGIQPMLGFGFITMFTESGALGPMGNAYPSYNTVSRNFFATTGLRMLRGTTFDEHAPSVVVNDAMARLVWPGRDALGECLYLEKRESDCYRVTGIVENARRSEVLEKHPAPIFYVPRGRFGSRTHYANVLVIRARPGADHALVRAMQAALTRAMSGAYVTVQSMNELLERQYRPWRLGAQLFGAVSMLALLVAIVGVYSTVAYSVSQRTQEFGVRIALGARTGDVVRQVVGDGLRVVTLGVLIGLALTLAGGRLIAALLYGIKPTDPETLIVVSLALLATAAAAALLPAWRAARTDPVTALRAD